MLNGPLRRYLWLHRLSLCIVLVGAVIVRLPGLDALLPHSIENDPHSLVQAEYFSGTRKANWLVLSKYPHLLGMTLAGFGAGITPGAAATGDSLEDHLQAAAAPIRRGREIVLALSALLVPATALLARRVAGRGTATIASILVATDLLHLMLSTEARPHGPFASFALLSLLASLRLRRGASIAGYLLAGTAAGLAIGCLHFGFFLLPPLVLAHLFRPARHCGRLRIVFALLPVLAAIPIFYPFLFSSPPHTGGTEFIQLGSHEFTTFTWSFVRLLRSIYFVFLENPPLVVLAFIGAAAGVLARRAARAPRNAARRADRLVILAFVVPFVLVVGGFMMGQVRYLLPVVPFLAVLAACGIRRVIRRITHGIASRRTRRFAYSICTLAILSVPTGVAARFATLQQRPDTLEAAARWLRDHTDRNDIVALELGVSLPVFVLPQGPDRFTAWWSPWDRYQHSLPSPLPRNQSVRVVRLSSPSGSRDESAIGVPRTPGAAKLALDSTPARYAIVQAIPGNPMLAAARRNWLPVATFLSDPIEPESGVEEPFDDFDMFLRAVYGIAWGPPLEIFERVAAAR